MQKKKKPSKTKNPKNFWHEGWALCRQEYHCPSGPSAGLVKAQVQLSLDIRGHGTHT